MRVISVSGGRSSGMMLKIMLDNGLQTSDRVVFTNTGKERPETLDFVEEMASRWGVEITWLEFMAAPPLFRVVNHSTAARKGEPFEAWIRKSRYLPNAAQRFCTADLKIKTVRRFVRSLGHRGCFDNFLGLRFDEPARVAKKKAENAAGKSAAFHRMPLHEMRVTRPQVAAFWKSQPFDLGIPSRLGNCDLCFMKGETNLIWTIREAPELADWWIEMENIVSQSGRKNRDAGFQKNGATETCSMSQKTRPISRCRLTTAGLLVPALIR